jgi:hypothetical protein
MRFIGPCKRNREDCKMNTRVQIYIDDAAMNTTLKMELTSSCETYISYMGILNKLQKLPRHVINNCKPPEQNALDQFLQFLFSFVQILEEKGHITYLYSPQRIYLNRIQTCNVYM